MKCYFSYSNNINIMHRETNFIISHEPTNNKKAYHSIVPRHTMAQIYLSLKSIIIIGIIMTSVQVDMAIMISV